MIKKFINTSNLEKADAVIISAPYEKTASFHKGTKNGPKKVLNCLDTQIEFFDRDFHIEINDFIKTAHLSLNNLDKLSPVRALQKIKESSEKLVKKDKFVFLLGGEHSVSLGLLQALSEKHNPREITVLHLDAHCDLRNDDSDYNKKNPSKFAHSTVIRRANELGYPIVQVGIRTYSKEEYEYFKNPKNRIKVFEWDKGDKPKIKQILDSIKTKKVYISIDVDGFDPSVCPGTGTPVPGGIKWNYGVKLLNQVVEKFDLIAGDLVEVSPMKDSVLTEYTGAQLIYNIFTRKFKNRI